MKRRRFLEDFGRRLREAGVETAPLTGPVARSSSVKRKLVDYDVSLALRSFIHCLLILYFSHLLEGTLLMVSFHRPLRVLQFLKSVSTKYVFPLFCVLALSPEPFLWFLDREEAQVLRTRRQ